MADEARSNMSRGRWMAAALSAGGAFVFFLWQPISDYFVTGTYDDNIVLQVDADSMRLDEQDKLLVVRLRVSNRGSVPVRLHSKGKGALHVEIRHIANADTAEWVIPHTYPVVVQKPVFELSETELSVAPNAYLSLIHI